MHVPLTVVLQTDKATVPITKEVRGLSFRKTVPGGNASARFRLSRPLQNTPDEIGYYDDVKIVDGRNGNIIWDGRQEDPGRSASPDSGEEYDLLAGGGMTHAEDKTRAVIYNDRRLSGWVESGFTNMKSGEISLGDGDIAVASIKYMVPPSTAVTIGEVSDILSAAYQDIRYAGQKLARIAFTHKEGLASTDWRMKVVTRVDDGVSLGSAINQPWTTGSTNASIVVGASANFPDGHNVADIRIDRDGSNRTATKDDWALVWDVVVRAMLKDINGVDIKNVTEGFEDTIFDITMHGDWARDNFTAQTGSWSLKSATITHGEVTSQFVQVPSEATTLRFGYRVSTEAGFDFFRVFMDGVEILESSGEVAWTTTSAIDVTSAKVIEFRYTKDSTVSAGSDAVWIDNVAFSNFYAKNTVLAHDVFADVIGRMCPLFDPVSSSIATTTYEIEQLAYPDGTTARGIFDDLLLLHPAYYWAVWEKQANGKYRFELKPWPTTVRYEATIADGYDSTGSSEELFNEVIVRYRGTRGQILHTTRTQVVPTLDDKGIIRTAFIDLGDNTSSLNNANQVGDSFLLEHKMPLNAGRLTIQRRILDRLTGMMVDPWEIEPGYLIRVRGIQPFADSLNAINFNGISVFRIVEMEYESDDNAAQLALDTYPPSVARAIADLQVSQRAWGRTSTSGRRWVGLRRR